MNWTFNNIRIFVDKKTGGGKQIIPLLQPLSGGTIVQFYGFETPQTQISGLIVGNDDLNALLALIQSGTGYTLNAPEGTLGAFYVQTIKYSRTNSIYQTMRPDLACESPVYSIDLDLIQVDISV